MPFPSFVIRKSNPPECPFFLTDFSMKRGKTNVRRIKKTRI